MNRFKLWLNRNDFKIIILIICISMGHIFLKGVGSYYGKNENNSNSNSTTLNTSLENNIDEQIVETENFTELEKSSEESQNIIFVIKKIIYTIYQANISNDNLSLRQDIYNMFSEKMIQGFFNEGSDISVDSVLNYIIYVDNLSNYAIGNIYKCKENNNISKYAIVLRYKIDENNISDNYFILNIDYNNNTFSYDGIVNDLSEVDIYGELNEIKNKNSNVF